MVELKSEISATVWQVTVRVGDRVEAGTTVAILESMKMEIPVDAAASGVVAEIRVQPGTQVKEGDVLVAIDIS